MNIENALLTLGFDNTNISEISNSELKQQYRMYALMYHPDKNTSPDASIRFVEIKEAYDLLQNYFEEEGEEDTAYHRILKEYLGIQIIDNKLNEVLDNILSVCEKQSILILEKIEVRKFQMMYSVLTKYKHIFFLSDEFYQRMEEIKERKTTKKQPIILNPSLNDLIQHMIYKLHRNDEIYLVPLWYHELIYEDKKTGEEFTIQCIPNLKNHEDWIDDRNNIHYHATYTIQYIFEKSMQNEQIEVKIGDYKTVFFKPWELNIMQTQTVRWKKEGISVPDSEINDISKKADIYLHILLI